MEFYQLRENPSDYFSDFWNIFDFSSLLINAAFIIMINLIQLSDVAFVKAETIRFIGSFACWFLWIKIFYWLRLYRNTAQFIKLIVDTIIDIRYFSFMVALIMMAFANFYWILNLNNKSNKEQIISERTGILTLDTFIQIYLQTLGEFSTDGFSEGRNKFMCWQWFIFATAIINVVFMNMLIAIMANTFANV